MRLKGKVALITGSSSGIGKGIADAFHREGAYVIVSNLHHEEGMKIAKGYGDRGAYFPLDVTSEEQWNALPAFLQERGLTLNVLINNAGVIGFEISDQPMDPEYATLEDWNTIHNINSTGTFLGCRMGIRLMKEKGGSIINMSSRSGNVGVPEAAAYASSRAATRNHSKSVALYCAAHDYPIRCNSLHPASILTPMWNVMLEGGGDELKHKYEQSIPVKRFGTPEDVAYGAIYLASDESSFMTGSELHIDGGLLAGSMVSPAKAHK